jgi:hypothetical protein
LQAARPGTTVDTIAEFLAAHKVRITGQLIDATTGAHLWAERFESALDDIFELQDQVTEAVVGAIVPQLERAEGIRARLFRH